MGERCPHSPAVDHRLADRAGGSRSAARSTAGTAPCPRSSQDPLEQVFVAVYDVTREDESALDGWEAADSGLYRKTKVRVSTLTGEIVVWTYVLDAYEGGLPSASYLGVLADAAEAADAPADYVAAPARPALPVDRALGSHGGRSGQVVARLGRVADRLDVVAVRVADERAVVGLVVLRPEPRLVQHLGAERRRGLEERADRGGVLAVNATWISRFGPDAGPSAGCRPARSPACRCRSRWPHRSP